MLLNGRTEYLRQVPRQVARNSKASSEKICTIYSLEMLLVSHKNLSKQIPTDGRHASGKRQIDEIYAGYCSEKNKMNKKEDSERNVVSHLSKESLNP